MIISDLAIDAVVESFGLQRSKLSVVETVGGYSRNRRAIVGDGSRWLFVKEVDKSLLPGDGVEELGWIRKEHGCISELQPYVKGVLPEWSKLLMDGHVLVTPAYRQEDGWMWSPPEGENFMLYTQSIIEATKRLEPLKVDEVLMDQLNLHPYFRDKLAFDDGLEQVLNSAELRQRLKVKFQQMANDINLNHLHRGANKVLELLADDRKIEALIADAKTLADQPNDCFGHCDVRSDNVTYNLQTGEVRFVDWNWASLSPSGFGATEFLMDLAMRGHDISPWVKELNMGLVTAVVGFYLRRCTEEPLGPGNTLRDKQAQLAAIGLDLLCKSA